jgi:hypothetical protein
MRWLGFDSSRRFRQIDLIFVAASDKMRGSSTSLRSARNDTSLFEAARFPVLLRSEWHFDELPHLSTCD